MITLSSRQALPLLDQLNAKAHLCINNGLSHPSLMVFLQAQDLWTM